MDSDERSGLTFGKYELALTVVGAEWRQIAEVIAITDYMASMGLMADKWNRMFRGNLPNLHRHVWICAGPSWPDLVAEISRGRYESAR